MASRLSFQIDFQGLDTVLAKLKLINKELASMGRASGGNVASPANISGGGRGSSNSGASSFLGASAGNLLSNGANSRHNGMTPGEWLTSIGVGPQNSFNHNARLLFNTVHGTGASGGGTGSGGAGNPPALPGAGGGGFGGWKNLGIIVSSVVAAFYALKKAVDIMVSSFQRGAEAFQNAARIGHGVGETAQLMEALKAIGISEQPTMRMILEAQRNRSARRFGVAGTDVMIAAARSSGFGNVQQLQNMSKQFELVTRATEGFHRQMDRMAGVLEMETMMWHGVVREFNQMLSQLAAALSPLIVGFLGLVKIILKFINILLEGIIWIENKLGLKGFNPPGQEKLGAMNSMPMHSNAWANIGFVMPGGGPTKILSNIEKNTKDIAKFSLSIKDYIMRGRMHGTVAFPGEP